jgi:hypothetical protein
MMWHPLLFNVHKSVHDLIERFDCVQNGKTLKV